MTAEDPQSPGATLRERIAAAPPDPIIDEDLYIAMQQLAAARVGIDTAMRLLQRKVGTRSEPKEKDKKHCPQCGSDAVVGAETFGGGPKKFSCGDCGATWDG